MMIASKIYSTTIQTYPPPLLHGFEHVLLHALLLQEFEQAI